LYACAAGGHGGPASGQPGSNNDDVMGDGFSHRDNLSWGTLLVRGNKTADVIGTDLILSLRGWVSWPEVSVTPSYEGNYTDYRTGEPKNTGHLGDLPVKLRLGQ
jgi:hypothetical protein